MRSSTGSPCRERRRQSSAISTAPVAPAEHAAVARNDFVVARDRDANRAAQVDAVGTFVNFNQHG